VYFVWIWEQIAIIPLYSINWLVFIIETVCVYCAVRTECLNIIRVNLSLRSAHTVHFVWIWEQTAIIPLYSINWLVFITETVCVYCAVRTGYLNIIRVNLSLRSAHTAYLCVLCGSEEENSDYFPLQHWLTGFYNCVVVFTARYGLNI